MTLERLRPVADRLLQPWVRGADRLGLTPNAVSGVAFGCAFAAGVAYALAGTNRWWYVLGAVLVFANGWLDLVDGALARRQDTASARGDLIDHVLDRYADIAIVAGLAAGAGQYLLGLLAITGVLMTSYLGTQAIAVGMDRVYGGLLGRADRLMVIGMTTAATAAYPEPLGPLTLVGWLLVVLALVGHATAVQRFVLAERALA